MWKWWSHAPWFAKSNIWLRFLIFACTLEKLWNFAIFFLCHRNNSLPSQYPWYLDILEKRWFASVVTNRLEVLIINGADIILYPIEFFNLYVESLWKWNQPRYISVNFLLHFILWNATKFELISSKVNKTLVVPWMFAPGIRLLTQLPCPVLHSALACWFQSSDWLPYLSRWCVKPCGLSVSPEPHETGKLTTNLKLLTQMLNKMKCWFQGE